LKETCEKCGTEKIMYYKIYCPKCTKPELEIVYRYNLLECLYHIEANDHEDFKEKFWKFFMDNYEFCNGTQIEIINDLGSDPLIQELFKKIEIEDEIMTFYVSW
jgi:hypothetical protein